MFFDQLQAHSSQPIHVCSLWQQPKVGQHKADTRQIRFTLKVYLEDDRDLYCGVSARFISHLLDHGTLWCPMLSLSWPLSYLLQHSPLLMVGHRETCGMFCCLSQISCNSHCCVCMGHHKIGYKPFYTLARDSAQQDFSLWVCLIHHLTECHLTQAVQGFRGKWDIEVNSI